MPDFKLKYIIDADGKKLKSELNSVDDQFARLGGRAAEAGGLSASSMNAIAIGAGAAAAGVLAIVGATATVTRELFDLSRQAADFGSIIFDASEKTGLSAQKLSAMKFAADQSGTALENVTAGAAKFAKTIGEAGNGSDKAQAKLDRLGVTSADLDTALKQALATIAKLPPGTQQMTAAMDAFGKTGADLLPFIKSFNGDLDALTEQVTALGLTLTDEQAMALDQYGDQLDTVSAQVKGLGIMIGLEFMPLFMEAAQFISSWMAENRGEVRSWADDSVSFITRLIQIYGEWNDGMDRLASGTTTFSRVYLAAVGAVEQSFPQIRLAIYLWDTWANSIDKIIEKGREARGLMASMGGQISPVLGGAPTISAGTPGGRSARSMANNDADRAERERIAGIRKNYNDEIQLRHATDAAKLQSIKTRVAQSILTEDDGFKLIQVLEKRQLEFKRQAMADTLALVRGNAEEEERITRDLAVLDQQITSLKLKHQEEIATAEQKNFKGRIDAAEKQMELEIKLVGKRIDQEIEINKQLAEQEERRRQMLNMGPNPDTAPAVPGAGMIGLKGSILDAIGLNQDLEDNVTSRTQIIGDAFTRLGGIVGDAVGNMAQGLGSMVEQWVLYGTAGPDALRKMTAAVLGNLAAQATVEAIMELARGFAALASPFTAWQAPLHFKSAALFGVVAAGAALAGRAIAGDSFTKGGGGSGRGSGSSSGSSGDRYQNPVSRVSNDAFISGTRNDGPLVEIGRAVVALHNKIDAMRPGDVLTVGMKQQKGAVTRQVIEETKSNASFGVQMKRVMGDR